MYYNPNNLKNAKKMRSNMTPAETKMWRFYVENDFNV